MNETFLTLKKSRFHLKKIYLLFIVLVVSVVSALETLDVARKVVEVTIAAEPIA
jgi:hypothetical protein